MKDRSFCASTFAIVLLSLVLSTLATAQRPAARITQSIDPNQRVTLQGNIHPLARAEFDRGPAPDSMIANRMLLLLSRSDEQEKALQQLLDDQQTAGSPNFHKWLTPEEFGQQFGPPDGDVQTVSTWLLNNGFQVTEVAPGRNVIEFSGTAGQLRQVFHTDIHKYVVNGEDHWANADDPQIPAALAPVVKGITSLNNFPRRSQANHIRPFKRDVQTGEASPLMTSGGSTPYYLLGPGDFSVIYNSGSLIQSGTNGAGQTIAIVGRTNINVQDVTDFRNFFGLPNTPDNHTSVVLNGPDPGILDGDETEALLDVEWSGASAPGASIVLVASESTLTGDGIDLSALYIVEHDLAPVMSTSYGNCEAALGTAGNQFYKSLWEQAAAQGITAMVSAGDNGSAGCDDPNSQSVASHGIAVNGLASTPFNIAVGGTDFDDAGSQTTYFNSTNTAGTWTSAKSYIPEMPWNDGCAGGTSPTTGSCNSSANLQLWAGSGGPSNCSQGSGGSCIGTAKPSWQTGTGVPADGVRDVPDISLFAATGSMGSRSLYVMCEADLVPGNPSCQIPSGGSGGFVYLVTIAGTSASSPAFAGAVALANQKTGHRLGNLNYLLYSIAAKSGASCTTSSTSSSCIFHDVAIGSNSVPCQGGTSKCSATSGTGTLVDSGKLAYLAGAGYDRATGLGSPNITNLVNAIAAASFTPTTTNLTLNGAATPVTATHGQAISVGVSVSPTSSTGDVSLIGNNGTTDNLGIDSLKLTSGVASWSSTLFPGGTYTVHAHYPGDGSRGASDSTAVSVNISPENSKTFVNVVTFDLTGNLTSFTGSAAEYGSPYILRMDVGDSAATISSATGVSSKCTGGTASCPTGTLTVTANGTALDGGNWKLNNAGHAEDQPVQLTPGAYNIVANYPGDASYNASSGSSSITINKATTSLTAAAAVQASYPYETAFPITATVTTSSNGAAPGGTFTWLDNGVNASSSVAIGGITPVAGSATAPASIAFQGWFTPSSLGNHTITAQYTGDPNYAASTGSFSVTVTPATVNSANYGFTPNAATPSLPVTLTIVFFSTPQAGTPTGTITFSDNGTPLTGTVTYVAQDGYFSGTMTHTFSQTGQHVVSATYSGDTYHLSATQQLGTLTVYDKIPTTMGVVSSSTPALVNYSTNLITSVGIPSSGNLPTPTGTITFSDNGQQLAGTITYSTTFNGYGSQTLTAYMPYSFTTSGTHNVSANYSGDSTYTPGTGSLSLSVVDKYQTSIPNLAGTGNLVVSVPTVLNITVLSNQQNLGPVMTGTITLTDGNTPIAGTQTVSNQKGFMTVQVPYTPSTSGTHNITVQYSGDDHYAASSQAFAEQVSKAMYLYMPTSSATFPANGGSGSEFVIIYNNTSNAISVTLACTPDSTSATCSFSQNPVTVGANNSTVPTVNVTVPALSASIHHDIPFKITFVFAGILGLCLATRRRRALALTLIVAALGLAMISCGGGSSTPPPPSPPPPPSSATYHFTITGTDGVNTDSQVLTVTVQR